MKDKQGGLLLLRDFFYRRASDEERLTEWLNFYKPEMLECVTFLDELNKNFADLLMYFLNFAVKHLQKMFEEY